MVTWRRTVIAVLFPLKNDELTWGNIFHGGYRLQSLTVWVNAGEF